MGHRDYLAGVQDMSAVPVTVIANTSEPRVSRRDQPGVATARGEYLVLLNNDVVVTDGWLDQLMALASASTEGDSPRRALRTRRRRGSGETGSDGH